MLDNSKYIVELGKRSSQAKIVDAIAKSGDPLSMSSLSSHLPMNS